MVLTMRMKKRAGLIIGTVMRAEAAATRPAPSMRAAS